jgi:hypothetical protein
MIANCGRFSSDTNCKLVIMAPEDQRSELVEAASTHAVRSPGHQDISELRREGNQIVDVVEVP